MPQQKPRGTANHRNETCPQALQEDGRIHETPGIHARTASSWTSLECVLMNGVVVIRIDQRPEYRPENCYIER